MCFVCMCVYSKLPLPDDIRAMFRPAVPDREDKPDEHGGRMRSFPHERGNWASHVYISGTADTRQATFLALFIISMLL